MKREDFKEITAQHFKSCEEIIRIGNCESDELGITVKCSKCPFFSMNNTQNLYCKENYCGKFIEGKRDEKLVASATEFLKFRDNNLGGIAMEVLNIKPIKLKLKKKLVERLNMMKVGDVIETKKYVIGCEEDVNITCNDCYFDGVCVGTIKCYKWETQDELPHSFKVGRRWS